MTLDSTISTVYALLSGIPLDTYHEVKPTTNIFYMPDCLALGIVGLVSIHQESMLVSVTFEIEIQIGWWPRRH